MHRFYLPPNEWQSGQPTMTGGEAHHAGHVLRLGRGDRAVLFDGAGREATAEITGVDSAGISWRVLRQHRTAPLHCRITLAQAIPKGKNMDLIVQKAVEIGVAEIAPLLSDRTVVQLDGEAAGEKRAKWQSIAIEAAKQCGQNWLPQIEVPRRPAQFFAGPARREDLCLIGSLQPGARRLKKVLAGYEQRHGGKRPASVLMLVGPEGDFTPAEIALAQSHGCQPLTLGPIILRVETAAIYCLSILSYELFA